MKKMRMIVLAAFAAVSMSVSAQESFQTFYLQYNPSSQKISYDGHSTSTSFNGLSLGYSYATPLGGIPLYLEFGGAAQWFFKSEDDTKTNLISVKIPVNLLYSFEVSDVVKIQPYAGVYGRVNIIGKTKDDYADESWDWFSDGDAKRFQLGLNGGLRVSFNDYVFLGAGYYYDLMKIQEHTHFEGFDLTLGLVF